MIMKATKTIEEAFKAQNWSYSVDEHPESTSSAVITGFDLKCGANVQIFFISAADNDVAIRVFKLIHIPAGKEHAAIHLCNDMNCQYRFAKFAVSGEYVGIQMDMPVETQNVDKVCVELLYRLLDIADNAYPVFQKEFGAPAAPASPNGADRF